MGETIFMTKLVDKIKQFVGISFWDSVYKACTFRDFFIAASSKCLLRKVSKVRKTQKQKIEQLQKQGRGFLT